MAQLAASSVEGTNASNSGIPKSLTRRFEVTIIPRAVEAVRKLREVKSNGGTCNTAALTQHLRHWTSRCYQRDGNTYI